MRITSKVNANPMKTKVIDEQEKISARKTKRKPSFTFKDIVESLQK